MKVLITGSTGQLGSEIVKLFDDVVSSERKLLNLENPSKVYEILDRIKPAMIINCAAMTDVDACQTNRERAYNINAASPSVMATYAIKNNIRFIHFSTDFVFNGEAGNYSEDSVPDPINYYGMSKIMGDMAVESVPNHLIVRTSGVYGVKNNFPVVVYKRLRDGKEVRVIDSYYSPIHSKNLARAASELIKSNFSGKINISGERISRKDFALRIADFFRLDSSKIIESKEFSGQIARRPRDSSLNIDEARSVLKWDFYSVKANLSQMDVKNLSL